MNTRNFILEKISSRMAFVPVCLSVLILGSCADDGDFSGVVDDGGDKGASVAFSVSNAQDDASPAAAPQYAAAPMSPRRPQHTEARRERRRCGERRTLHHRDHHSWHLYREDGVRTAARQHRQVNHRAILVYRLPWRDIRWHKLLAVVPQQGDQCRRQTG